MKTTKELIEETERCCDCKKEKPINEFVVGHLVSIRCNKCRRKLIEND